MLKLDRVRLHLRSLLSVISLPLGRCALEWLTNACSLRTQPCTQPGTLVLLRCPLKL